MNETRRRWAVTLGAIAALFLLRSLPIPGVDASLARLPAVAGGVGPQTLRLLPLHCGSLSLAPYLYASALMVLVDLVRRRPAGSPGERLRPTILLAIGVSLVMSGAAAAAYTRALGYEGALGSSGPVLWVSILVTQTATSLLIVWLAHVVSRHGFGNGVCVLITANVLASVGGELVRGSRTGSLLGDNPILAALLLLGWIAALVAWARASWTLRVPPGSTVAWLRDMPLRANGVGNIGIATAYSFLAGLFMLISFLPPGAAITRPFLAMSVHGTAYEAWFGIVALAGGLFWTRIVYDTRALTASVVAATVGDERVAPVEAQVLRATGPYILLSVLGVIAVSVGMRSAGVHGFSPVPWFMVVATVMGVARQFALHREMAGTHEAGAEARCDRCQRAVLADATRCPGCGVAFEEGATCARHEDRGAIAHCIACDDGLCAECDATRRGRHLCAAHVDLDFVEGWAAVGTALSRRDAEIQALALRQAGTPAVVLTNDCAPFYGTLGLFDLRPRVVLAAQADCGGGQSRVFVPAARWRSATESGRQGSRTTLRPAPSPAGPASRTK